MQRELPSRAQVVVIGGGVVGCSIAYHLTQAGITDVVLLERKQLTCGTTWHAAKIETFVYYRVRSLFALASKVTLHDLTNTCFEGAVKGNLKAARGMQKNKAQ